MVRCQDDVILGEYFVPSKKTSYKSNMKIRETVKSVRKKSAHRRKEKKREEKKRKEKKRKPQETKRQRDKETNTKRQRQKREERRSAFVNRPPPLPPQKRQKSWDPETVNYWQLPRR